MTLAVESDAETVIDLSYYDSSQKPVHFIFWMGTGTSYKNTTPIKVSQAHSTCQIVKWMRDEGLPISIIADIMNVERKSIYSWLKGSICNENNRERLEQVYFLLSEGKIASLRNLYRFWSRKVHNKSLGILFNEKSLNERLIRMTLKELWPLAKKMQENEIKTSTILTIKNNPILKDSRTITFE